MSLASTVIVIYGPTASGKSALALELAQAEHGVVINADSMQCYAGIPILTAAPQSAEKAKAPHRLYEYVDPAHARSAADWATDAVAEIRTCWQGGQLPILVGGTGMYLKALMEGFSPLPDIDPDVREKVRGMDFAALQGALSDADPALSQKLKPGDTQRITRAYEVFVQTGKPLSYWQGQPPVAPLPEANFRLFCLDLPRELLYARCDARLARMVEQGALEELQKLLDRHLPDTLPAMRAVGLPELAAYLRGQSTLPAALAAAQQATRRYAKRQLTWARNQFNHGFPVTHPYANFPHWVKKHL